MSFFDRAQTQNKFTDFQNFNFAESRFLQLKFRLHYFLFFTLLCPRYLVFKFDFVSKASKGLSKAGILNSELMHVEREEILCSLALITFSIR